MYSCTQKRRICAFKAAFAVVTVISSTAAAADSQPAAARALLDRYCIGCHNQKLKTAKVALDTVDLSKPGSHAEVLERVLRKLRTGEMPPVGMPHPEPSAATAVANWLEDSLDKAAAANPNPGRPVVHRLNRAEYSSAIR